jgi:ankyrin repeat protein
MLDNGAKIDARDAWGITTLYWAYAKNETDLLELLLERGADWERFDGDRHESKRLNAVMWGSLEPGSPGRGLALSGINDFVEPVGI